jgi:hypothetical protein
MSSSKRISYNGDNTHTNYQSGADSHLDWDVPQFLSDAAYATLSIPLGGGKKK